MAEPPPHDLPPHEPLLNEPPLHEPPPPYTDTPSSGGYGPNDKADQSQSYQAPVGGYPHNPGQPYHGGPVDQQPYGQNTAFAPHQGQPGYGSIGQPIHIVTVPVGVLTQPHCSEFPCHVTCPQCHASVVTNTSYESGLLTWLIFGALLFFGCWLGCCLIPFCINDCKDVWHTCPNCNCTLGIYKFPFQYDRQWSVTYRYSAGVDYLKSL